MTVSVKLESVEAAERDLVVFGANRSVLVVAEAGDRFLHRGCRSLWLPFARVDDRLLFACATDPLVHILSEAFVVTVEARGVTSRAETDTDRRYLAVDSFLCQKLICVREHHLETFTRTLRLL